MDSGIAIAERKLGIDFARTRWSMVAAVREGGEIDARDSLRKLCRRYWVPVYAYVRCSGYEPEDANQLVQHFLSHLVQRLRVDQSDISMGFRRYLETRLAEYLESAAAKDDLTRRSPPAEMAPPWPLDDIERRQQIAHPNAPSPTQALQRAFALEMLATALDALRKEAQESERGELFDAVRPFLGREPTQADYDALAQLMGSSQLAAIIAVKRLRQRFQELIDDALAETVGDPQALENERHTLLTLVMPDQRK
jgi:RNA polymerase sigma-70 factor (ECF subfamily)